MLMKLFQIEIIGNNGYNQKVRIKWNIYLFIYLLQFADIIEGISFFFIIIFTLLFIGLTINLMVTAMDGCSFIPDEDDKLYKTNDYGYFVCRNYIIKGLIISFVTSILLSLIPTKQTLLMFGGTYLGKKAVNTVVTDEKIKKIDTIINLQLDKYIKDLQIESKEE